MKYILAVSFFLILTMESCYYDKADKLYPKNATCDTTNVSFSATIMPIISQNCSISGCHDATTQAGGYDYTTYSSLIQTQNIQNGKLIGAINQRSGFFAMPQTGAKLSACNISKITAWINQGYPNN